MKNHHIVERSIIKVSCYANSLDVTRPWINSSFREDSFSGTGFCILINDKKFIMTNAHVVRHAVSVQVRAPAGDSIYAIVVYVSNELDLALLYVDDAGWMDSLLPIKFNKVMPNKLDTIYIYGFPGGGDINININVTKGILNRIEHRSGGTLGYRVLSFQADVTVNPGNSGGPAVDKNGELIGVAYAKSSGNGQWVENISWIITPPNVKLFIESFSDVMYDILKHKKADKDADTDNLDFPGICSLNIYSEPAEHITIRKWLKIPDNVTGCLISFNDRLNISSKHFKEYDVLTAIDGYNIDNIGNMAFSDVLHSLKFPTGKWKGSGESVPLYFIINLKRPGEKITLDIWRDGKIVTEKFAIEIHKPTISPFTKSHSAKYFILMGMVFLPLTGDVITEKYDKEHYMNTYLYYIDTHTTKKSPNQEWVLLSETIETTFTNGFPSKDLIVKSVGDKEIINLEHFYNTVYEHIKANEFIIIKYYSYTDIIVIDPADFKKYDDTIRERYIGKVPAYSA